MFTGSHDATLRVWDITGITDETVIGRDGVGMKKDEKAKNEPNGFMNGRVEPENNMDNGKIQIGEDENMNGVNYHAMNMENNHQGHNEKILI